MRKSRKILLLLNQIFLFIKIFYLVLLSYIFYFIAYEPNKLLEIKMNKSTNHLQIRPFQPLDESKVIALWHQCGLVVSQNDPKSDIDTKLQFQPDLMLVGTIQNDLVASVMIGYEGHRGWINYLAVAPEFQKQGIGHAMMKRVESILKSMGCPKINLQVRSQNKAVISFYEKIGYKVENVTSMGKRL